MADAVAVFVLALQYLLLVFAVKYFWMALPLGIVVDVFIALAIAAIVYWHKKKSSREVREWRRLIVLSIIIGVLFDALDLLLFHLDIGGGILSFPLNIVICPIFTIICVAGLVRALYIGRRDTAHRAQSSQA